MLERYQELFEEMEIEMTDELDPEDPKFDSKKRKHPLYKLQLQLEGYLQELPVHWIQFRPVRLERIEDFFFIKPSRTRKRQVCRQQK